MKRAVVDETIYIGQRGSWLFYLLAILLLHLAIRCLPFVVGPMTWTLTNSIHHLVSYYLLHAVKGPQWENAADQGRSRRLTYWEQIDSGMHFSSSKKFLTVVPIVLLMLTACFTGYEPWHLVVNGVTFLVVMLPKLPMFHKVRILDINKY